MAEKKKVTPPTGFIPFIFLFYVIGSVIGVTVSRSLEKSGSVAARLATITSFDLGYLYLAAFVVTAGMTTLTMMSSYGRAGANIDRPDQYVYRTVDEDKKGKGQVVLMDNEGVNGVFNRRQRAYFNTLETLPTFVANLLLVGVVVPRTALAVAITMAFGRILYSRGYGSAANGRTLGFLLGNMIPSYTLSGLLLVIGFQTIGVSAAAGYL
jgi:uncharacterized MAPEG superfamily protein